ncbi:MAG: LemA family protein [Patescibacteria group bacterium]|nr:LemA family protein [Patescibacteria group bacterium]
MRNALFITLGVVAAIALFVGMWFMGTYNSLVTQDEVVTTSWAQVETQYQRRFDLIPNLVNATKGILTQEREVFGQIAEARTRYANAKQGGSQNEQVEAFGNYESVIGRLLLIFERYPELHSYDQVQSLMDELAGTENRVAVERRRYNEEVRSLNIMVKRFPTKLLANMYGFEERLFFEASVGSEVPPVVDLTL